MCACVSWGYVCVWAVAQTPATPGEPAYTLRTHYAALKVQKFYAALVQKRAAKREAMLEVTRLRRLSAVPGGAAVGLGTHSRRLHVTSTGSVALQEHPLGAPSSPEDQQPAMCDQRRPQSRSGLVAVPP